jgi:basic membrane lipoprotein Med (substrate-binding protein (PBP1-ABC) superfamily)
VRRAIAIACAVLATGCGSDTRPPAAAPARPVRIALLDPSPDLVRGVRDAERYVGAVETADETAADLVVTNDPGRAVRVADGSPDARVLLVGAAPSDPVPGNILVVQISRGQPAYLAGALAGLVGARSVSVVGGDAELAAAVKAGGAEAGAALQVDVAACGAPATGEIRFAERTSCLTGGGPGRVVAPAAVDDTDQLAVIGPRAWVAVTAAARAVQAGTWSPGVLLEGLRQDVVGIGWISPSVTSSQLDRLQRIEDLIRAGQAQIPVVAPVQQGE